MNARDRSIFSGVQRKTQEKSARCTRKIFFRDQSIFFYLFGFKEKIPGILFLREIQRAGFKLKTSSIALPGVSQIGLYP